MNNIALAGCGNVGTAFLEILHEKKSELKEKYGFEFKVVLITDLMKGVVLNPDGIDLGSLLDELHAKHNFGSFSIQTSESFPELLDKSRATMLAECTPTNLKTGEPGLSHLRAALSRGISVTTTNKGPIGVAFDELRQLARECGAKLGYEGVGMSGTPVIDMTLNGIAGCRMLGVEGILNGTTNYILTRMEDGASYSDALTEAISLGYAEADPSGDVEGWDAAVKLVILARILFDKEINVKDVKREGITNITQEEVSAAKEKGHSIKLIAGISVDDNGDLSLYVKPKEIDGKNPLAAIKGATNAVTIKTDNLGEITVAGPGAGRRETGQALLSDMIRMTRHR